MCDLYHEEVFKEKLKQNVEVKNKIICDIYDGEPLNFDYIYDEYITYANRLKDYVCDTSVVLYESIKSGKSSL